MFPPQDLCSFPATFRLLWFSSGVRPFPSAPISATPPARTLPARERPFRLNPEQGPLFPAGSSTPFRYLLLVFVRAHEFRCSPSITTCLWRGAARFLGFGSRAGRVPFQSHRSVQAAIFFSFSSPFRLVKCPPYHRGPDFPPSSEFPPLCSGRVSLSPP